MPSLTIDGRRAEVPPGSTILQAARAVGIEIPTLCFREGLDPATSCMVCVVKVRNPDRIVPACAAAAEDGLVVESETEEIREARRTALELLLGDHLGDCVAPCEAACPASLRIPRMLRRIRAARFDEAAAIAREDLVLPATLGRICPAPCEKGCRRGAIDAGVAIPLLHRFLGDRLIEAGGEAAGDLFLRECAEQEDAILQFGGGDLLVEMASLGPLADDLAAER